MARPGRGAVVGIDAPALRLIGLALSVVTATVALLAAISVAMHFGA